MTLAEVDEACAVCEACDRLDRLAKSTDSIDLACALKAIARALRELDGERVR